MRRILGVLVALSFSWMTTSRAFAEGTVVGQAVADAEGKGTIGINVNQSLNPKDVAKQIKSDVELTQGAKPEVVAPDTAMEGAVRIDFARATPGSTVEAILPEEAARRLLAGGLAAGATGGGAIAALLGTGAAVAAAGVVGGLAASGEFDSTQRVGTIAK